MVRTVYQTQASVTVPRKVLSAIIAKDVIYRITIMAIQPIMGLVFVSSLFFYFTRQCFVLLDNFFTETLIFFLNYDYSIFFFSDDLTIDYQFTFNLSKKDDRYYTQINFKNSPPKPDVDADFTITCSVMAKMNITIKTGEYLC